MAISNITTNGASTSTSANPATSTLSANYEMFLTLLTAQLQNQNPLQPMDANQFTQQLVQYSSIEQQIKTNTTLEGMKSQLAINNATSLLNYVGANVTAEGKDTQLTGGKAEWHYKIPESASGTIKIRDATGKVVKTEDMKLPQGDGTYTWDGKLDDGGTAPDGTYTIEISAKNAAGSAVKADTTISGKVEKLDFSDGGAYLYINGVKVSVWSVTSIASH